MSKRAERELDRITQAEAREIAAALANAKRKKDPDYLGPADLPPPRIAGDDYPTPES